MKSWSSLVTTAFVAVLATIGALVFVSGLLQTEVRVVLPGALLAAGAIAAFALVRRRTPPERRVSLVHHGLVAGGAAALTAAGLFSMLQSGSRTSPERNAAVTLVTLRAAEQDFRANDRDGNREQDYWTGDVAGLYRCEKLIERSVAAADAAPLPGSDVGERGPKYGYWYRTMMTEGPRHPDRFAFCAYPEKPGRPTFIVNEENIIWRKDTGGKPPPAWPKDPKAEGWSKLD